MMKSIDSLWLALICGIVILANSGNLQAETNIVDRQHSHTQYDHAASGLVLDHGKKWKTDAALRQGMQIINVAVMKAVPAYHDESLTEADAVKLSRQINEQVSYLIENCKLEPGADATLHVLIGDLLTAATRAESEPLSPQGLPYLVKTLQLYPDYFEQQNWRAFTEK